MAAEHGLYDGAFVKLEVVLRKHGEPFAGAEGHEAVGGGELAGEHAHQRGLAGAVGTDDAVAVPFVEGQVYVLEECSFTELDS